MSAVEPLQALVAYNEKANGILLDAISGLAQEQLDAKHRASWDSIRATMQHALRAQNVWLKRFGLVVGSAGDDLRSGFEASHTALGEFILACSAEDLARVVEYVDSRGAAFAVPLWQLVVHVCNHGTHHRAECGLMLGELGRSPGDIDFVYHVLGKI